MIFHTGHRYSVADRLSSKSLVCVEYQLQGFHGNKTCCNVVLFIAYKWRHIDVIIINLIAFTQNEIPYKTYISYFFVLGK